MVLSVFVAATLAGCTDPPSPTNTVPACEPDDVAAPGRTCDAENPRVESFLPSESELPAGFRAPQATEGGEAALVLGNRSNPHIEADMAFAWYQTPGDPPGIFITVERVEPSRLKPTLPRLHVCEPSLPGVERYLVKTEGYVAYYVLSGDDPGPTGQPDGGFAAPSERPSQGPAFMRMVDDIALRTGAADGCEMQSVMFGTVWEEPNNSRTQATTVDGYYTGLQVSAGDDDWYHATILGPGLGYVQVSGEGVSASVEYASGTVVPRGENGWWFELAEPAEMEIFVRVHGTGTYNLTIDTGERSARRA